MLREKIIRFVVLENEPFTITESESLREAFAYSNPEAKLFSGDTTKADIVSMYKTYQDGIMTKLRVLNTFKIKLAACVDKIIITF